MRLSTSQLYRSKLHQTQQFPIFQLLQHLTEEEEEEDENAWKQWMILLWGKRNINKMKNWKHRRELQKHYERKQDL